VQLPVLILKSEIHDCFSFHSSFVRNRDFKYSCFMGLVAIF
jgi:hypothetical protein